MLVSRQCARPRHCPSQPAPVGADAACVGEPHHASCCMHCWTRQARVYPQAERASSAAHVGGGGGDDGCPVATRWASSCPHFRWLIGGPNSSTPQLKESRGSIYWRARRRSRAPWSRPRAMRTRTMLAGCPQSSLAGPPHVCAFLSTVRALLGKRHRCVRDGRVRCWSCPWRGRRRRRRSCACMVRPRRAKEAARSLSSAPLVPGAGGGGCTSYQITTTHALRH